MRLILITFVLLGFAWYELSGGADFAPGDVGLPDLAASTDDGAVSRTDFPDSAETPIAGERIIPIPAPEPEVEAADPPVLVTRLGESGADTRQATAPPPVVAGYRRVNGSRVVLREGPGLRFDRVTELLDGETVALTGGARSGWVELRADGNVRGWVREDDLRQREEASGG